MEGQIKIAFVGDIAPGGLFVRTGGVDGAVLDYLRSFDLRVGTLETALGDGSRLCKKKNTPQLGTIIFSPDESVKMLVDMGINAVSLANNHACDCDLEGLYHTMVLLDQNGIVHFGAGRNVEEAGAPAVIDCGGKTICLLGYLQEYNYFYQGEGYHPTDSIGGVNIYDKAKAIADVKRCKALYDYVFVMPHWGAEGSVWPRFNELVEARQMIEAGADGVIASHAHIVQPTIRYKHGIIAMNLGNFAFPDRYVVKPRISYYPSDEELANQEIPEVYAFKKVDRLSLKVVSGRERKGVVLGVSLAENKIAFSPYHTILSKDNLVKQRDKRSLKERFAEAFVALMMKEKWGILYRIIGRLRRIFSKKRIMRWLKRNH